MPDWYLGGREFEYHHDSGCFPCLRLMSHLHVVQCLSFNIRVIARADDLLIVIANMYLWFCRDRKPSSDTLYLGSDTGSKASINVEVHLTDWFNFFLNTHSTNDPVCSNFFYFTDAVLLRKH